MSNNQNNSYNIKSVDKIIFETTDWMGPLNDENKLKFDEKNNKN